MSTEIHHIPNFAGKIIQREASFKKAASLEIVAPTIIAPDEEFTLKILMVDEKGFPVINDGRKFTLRAAGPKLELTFSFPHNGIAYAEIRKIKFKKEGIFRFETEFKNKKVFSNPCACRHGMDKKIFWGDPHIHSSLSNCMVQYSRSTLFAFNAARYLSCLDWAAVADHVSNGRCGLDKWKEQSALADACNDPGNFITLPAYEASLKGGKGGDNNVYMDKFPSIFIDEYENGSVKTLCRKLKELSQKENFDFFAVPHHTTRTGKHGEIPGKIYPGKKAMPVIEIHSKWGSSEYRGNPSPLKDVHPGPSYAADLLKQKLILGFIGGTDTHATMTFAASSLESGHIDRLPGLTAVCAEKLERDNVFQSIRDRNCYAACGERIYLNVTLNDITMGSLLKINSSLLRSRHIHIECAAKSNLKSVEIIRNGYCIKKINPKTWKLISDFEDKEFLNKKNSLDEGKFYYYYIRVRCLSGATAWSSPIWITA